jgi:signal transduction histidine kinase
MQPTKQDLPRAEHRVLAYVAELELEVDRLRKHCELIYQDAADATRRIMHLCRTAEAANCQAALAEIEKIDNCHIDSLRELRVLPGYHPSRDQVVDIAFRPLAERVFRWRQRVAQLPAAALHLELHKETLEWFPVRLSHILDNLIANALDYSDPDKGEIRVTVGLQHHPRDYELRVCDNGLGMNSGERARLLELSRRIDAESPRRPGVGLAVVRTLVEESGGSLTVQSSAGAGTALVALLPRYDRDDFLTHGEHQSDALGDGGETQGSDESGSIARRPAI